MQKNPWNLPFSGDVTQAINPWSWATHAAGQFGFININTSKAGNPALEQDIVQNIASYGQQLARLLDVVNMLLEHSDLSKLSAQQQKDLQAFQQMSLKIDAVRLARQETVTLADAEAFLERVRQAEQKDTQQFQAVIQQLGNFVKTASKKAA